MKILVIAAIAVTVIGAPVIAQNTVNVRGHVTRDGVYVPPSVRTAPNDSRLDNWSSKGNVNPYNGKSGTVDPYAPKQPSAPKYGW